MNAVLTSNTKAIARKSAATGLVVLLAVSLSACGIASQRAEKKARVTFDGYRYKVRLETDKDAPENFRVEVAGADQSLDGAREAGAYKATQYCLKQYGLSDIAWVNNPEDPEAPMQLDGDTLLLSGTCRGW